MSATTLDPRLPVPEPAPEPVILAAQTTEADREIAEEVTLLFEAAFGRFVAIPGLNFHVNARLDGLGRERLAEQFLESDEFAARIGDPDTLTARQYVESLFRNILKREGAEDGIQFWVDRLESGERTEAQVLLAFAQNPENRTTSPEFERLALVDLDGTPTWIFDPDPNLSERLEGGEGVDFIRGLQGDDTLVGNAAGDVLWGGPGDDRLEGGPGGDIALYDFPRAEFAAAGTLEEATVTGRGFTDTLLSIETLRFSDGDVALADLLDPGAETISLSPAAASLTEATEILTFTVTRSGGTLEAATLYASTVDGTATGGQDFSLLADFPVAFEEGQTVQTVDVLVVEDTLDEASESFELVIATETGQAPDGATIADRATVTIQDDDGDDPMPGTLITTPGTLQATDAADVFEIRIDDQVADAATNPDFEGTARIEGFDASQDVLRFVNVEGSTVDAGDFYVLDEPGVGVGDRLFEGVAENPFQNSVSFFFAVDPGVGGAGVQLVIEGVAELDADADQTLDFIEIV